MKIELFQTERLDEIKEFFGELIFPSNLNCIGCGESIWNKNPYSLCHSCYQKLEFTDQVCKHCGRRTLLGTSCFCQSEHYYFDSIDTCLVYNDFLQKLIFRYKYGHQTYLSRFFTEILIQKLNEKEIFYDYITYVPIHRNRMRERGFNQTQVIAEMVGEHFSVPVVEFVTRTKDTPFLSSYRPFQRMLLVEDAFEHKEIEVQPKSNILLLDDIVTSGSTLSTVSKVIKKEHGSLRVHCIAIGNARA